MEILTWRIHFKRSQASEQLISMSCSCAELDLLHFRKILSNRSTIVFPHNIKLWVSLTVRASVLVRPCWISSFRTPPQPAGVVIVIVVIVVVVVVGPLRITNLNY